MKRLAVLSLCALMLLAPACGWRGRNNGACCGSTLYQGRPCCGPAVAAPCATPACTTAPAPCVSGTCEPVVTEVAPVSAEAQMATRAPMQAAEVQDTDSLDDLDLDEDLTEPVSATGAESDEMRK